MAASKVFHCFPGIDLQTLYHNLHFCSSGFFYRYFDCLQGDFILVKYWVLPSHPLSNSLSKGNLSCSVGSSEDIKVIPCLLTSPVWANLMLRVGFWLSLLVYQNVLFPLDAPTPQYIYSSTAPWQSYL